MWHALNQLPQRDLVPLVTPRRRHHPMVKQRVAELGGERAAEVTSALTVQRFFRGWRVRKYLALARNPRDERFRGPFSPLFFQQIVPEKLMLQNRSRWEAMQAFLPLVQRVPLSEAMRFLTSSGAWQQLPAALRMSTYAGGYALLLGAYLAGQPLMMCALNVGFKALVSLGRGQGFTAEDACAAVAAWRHDPRQGFPYFGYSPMSADMIVFEAPGYLASGLLLLPLYLAWERLAEGHLRQPGDWEPLQGQPG
jgi:hypothetical protein